MKLKYYRNYLIFFVLGFLLAAWLLAGEVELEKLRLKKLGKGEVLNGEANMVAVTNNGEGLIGKIKIDIYDGDGKVLINTNPFLEPDTQYSANIATKIAQNYTGISLKNKNVVFDFDIGNNVSVVGGPSAGAAMTIALIGALEHKQIDSEKVVTGTILPDGNIGWVGSILEKGESAEKNNLKEFLIPEGQDQFRYYERQVTQEKRGTLMIYRTKYIPKIVEIKDYFKDKLQIREVKTINDVADLLLKG